MKDHSDHFSQVKREIARLSCRAPIDYQDLLGFIVASELLIDRDLGKQAFKDAIAVLAVGVGLHTISDLAYADLWWKRELELKFGRHSIQLSRYYDYLVKLLKDEFAESLDDIS